MTEKRDPDNYALWPFAKGLFNFIKFFIKKEGFLKSVVEYSL